MQAHNVKNNIHNKVHVTRENLFVGLSLPERVEACIKMVDGLAKQFVNETSILLDVARKGASVYASCEAENDTDICAFLAQLDMEVQEIGEHTKEKLQSII